jgi:hypothetical protein
MLFDVSGGCEQHAQGSASVLLVGEVHLVRKAGLRDIAGGDQEQCGKAIVIAGGVAGVAIAVVRGELGGVIAWPFGPAVVFEKEAETRPSAAVTPVAIWTEAATGTRGRASPLLERVV